jgi:hypothetical protein
LDDLDVIRRLQQLQELQQSWAQEQKGQVLLMQRHG